MWRAVFLTLGLMLSLGVVIPLLTDSTEASSPQQYKKHKKYKKYSRSWWRAYHQRQRRNQTIAARKRILRERQEMLAKQTGNDGQTFVNQAVEKNGGLAILPSGGNAPTGWKTNSVSKDAVQFHVNDDGGNSVGAATITVVGPAIGADSNSFRSKAVGGVSTASLRRTVIDRMMKEDGWVVNDYQKEMNGKQVYVVVAQSKGAGGSTLSRLFYFAEADGKIYSVATAASSDNAERLARESEKVVDSLQHSNRSAQAELR